MKIRLYCKPRKLNDLLSRQVHHHTLLPQWRWTRRGNSVSCSRQFQHKVGGMTKRQQDFKKWKKRWENSTALLSVDRSEYTKWSVHNPFFLVFVLYHIITSCLLTRRQWSAFEHGQDFFFFIVSSFITVSTAIPARKCVAISCHKSVLLNFFNFQRPLLTS